MACNFWVRKLLLCFPGDPAIEWSSKKGNCKFSGCTQKKTHTQPTKHTDGHLAEATYPYISITIPDELTILPLSHLSDGHMDNNIVVPRWLHLKPFIALLSPVVCLSVCLPSYMLLSVVCVVEFWLNAAKVFANKNAVFKPAQCFTNNPAT